MDCSFVYYHYLCEQTTGSSVLHGSLNCYLLNSWRIDFRSANDFSVPKRCLEDCKAVCPSAMTMNTFLVLKDTVCLHSNAASHSIIHKNVVFNLPDDRCSTADPTYPLTHPQTPPFSHAFGVSSCNNSPFFLIFFLRIEKTYQEGLWDTEEREGQWLHVSALYEHKTILVVPPLKILMMLCSGAESWLKPLNWSYFKKKNEYMAAGLAYTLQQHERIRISKNNYRISIKYRSRQINDWLLLPLTRHSSEVYLSIMSHSGILCIVWMDLLNSQYDSYIRVSAGDFKSIIKW